jgi:hypothetical protein
MRSLLRFQRGEPEEALAEKLMSAMRGNQALRRSAFAECFHCPAGSVIAYNVA